MLRNYLKTALRNLSRHPFYTFINLFGLAIGMAAGFMILQYVQYDLSYDRFFDNKENIYRVKTNSFSQGELTEEWAAGIAGVGVRMKEYFPEVLDYVIMTPSNAQVSFKDKHLEPKYAYYASENFFQVFSVPLVSGVDSVILKEPFTVVVSETFAVGCNDGVVRCLDSSTLKEVCKAVYIFLNSLLLICNSVDEGEIGYN